MTFCENETFTLQKFLPYDSFSFNLSFLLFSLKSEGHEFCQQPHPELEYGIIFFFFFFFLQNSTYT